MGSAERAGAEAAAQPAATPAAATVSGKQAQSKGSAAGGTRSPGQAGAGFVLTDVKVSFWRMVIIIVKVSIAAIPAMMILTAIGFFVSLIMGFLGATLFAKFFPAFLPNLIETLIEPVREVVEGMDLPFPQ